MGMALAVSDSGKRRRWEVRRTDIGASRAGGRARGMGEEQAGKDFDKLSWNLDQIYS